MQTITKAPHLKLPVGIALVIDDNGRLIGTVTDGDIRRALVKLLISPKLWFLYNQTKQGDMSECQKENLT